MIRALGRGATGVTVIDKVAGRGDTGGCEIALFFERDVASDASTAFGRSIPRIRTSARAKPISTRLAM
jgi:hypothetical protein